VRVSPQTSLITRTSEYTTADHIKQVILALQVWCHADLTDGLLNSADRVESPISLISQNWPLTSLSSLTMDHERRNRWSSPFPRQTLVGCSPVVRRLWLMSVVLSVRILTDVVPRLELLESWTEDELVTVLHEAADDLGVVQKAFMTVLRHAVSGMKVWEPFIEACRILTTLADRTWGSGDHGYPWKRADCGSFTKPRDRILNMIHGFRWTAVSYMEVTIDKQIRRKSLSIKVLDICTSYIIFTIVLQNLRRTIKNHAAAFFRATFFCGGDASASAKTLSTLEMAERMNFRTHCSSHSALRP